MENERATQRQIVKYSEDDYIEIRDGLDVISAQIKRIERKTPLFSNQIDCARRVVFFFSESGKINQMVIGLTQCGKTGTMLAVIKTYIATNTIPLENIYIITGVSSNEWKDQTGSRLPPELQARVYHGPELNRKFIKDVKGKKNCLILMDEVQIAAKENQIIRRSFESIGLTDINYLLEHDIKIVEFTATPDGTLSDLVHWGEYSAKVKLLPGEGYVGAFELFQRGQVFQNKDLCGNGDEVIEANVKELVDFIQAKYSTPRWHIIRTASGDRQRITLDMFSDLVGKDNIVLYDQKNNDDINERLSVAPPEHRIIFVKEMLRCSKTLVKKHLGVVYDRYAFGQHDSTVIQGLVGRITGYDTHDELVCFTNLEPIERYKRYWDSDFEDTSIPWRSATTKSIRGETVSRNTFNKPDWVSEASLERGTHERVRTEYRIFLDIETVKKYCKIVGYNVNGNHMVRNGFILTSMPNRGGEKSRASVRFLSVITDYLDDMSPMVDNRTANGRTHRTCFPCYLDTKDASTLRFVVAIRAETDPAVVADADRRYPSVPAEPRSSDPVIRRREYDARRNMRRTVEA